MACALLNEGACCLAWQNVCPSQPDFLVPLGVGSQVPSLIRGLAFLTSVKMIKSLSCLKVFISSLVIGIRSQVLSVKDEAPRNPAARSFRDVHPLSLTLTGCSSILEQCALSWSGPFHVLFPAWDALLSPVSLANSPASPMSHV